MKNENELTSALAQSLKAAAEKAKHAGEAPIMSFDARISALNEYLITACPGNILALVEALENGQTKAIEQGRTAYELFDDVTALRQRIAELESRLNSADKLQDSAFRSGLQHGFSLGQTDDQKGYEQSMAAYSSHAGIKVEAE